MPKVSVIVPVYNSEKYLKECLDSILSQTMADIEIICVNDGSTDGSYDILDEYKSKDSRIKIINKPNTGYGSSLNLGILESRGEFIGVVESDDYIEPTTYELLYKYANQYSVDLVKCDWYSFSSKNGRNKNKCMSSIPNSLVNSIQEGGRAELMFEVFPPIWTFLYRRSFLLDNKIRFLETLGASYQSVSFVFKTLSLTKKVYLTSTPLIHYRKDNPSSSINNKEKVYFICKEYDEISSFLNKHSDLRSKLLTKKFINEYLGYMWNLSRIDEKFRMDFIDYFSSTFKKLNFKDKDFNEELFFSSIKRKEFDLLVLDPGSFYSYFKKRIFLKKVASVFGFSCGKSWDLV